MNISHARYLGHAGQQDVGSLFVESLYSKEQGRYKALIDKDGKARGTDFAGGEGGVGDKEEKESALKPRGNLQWAGDP